MFYLYLDLCIALCCVLGLKELPVNLRDNVLAENYLDVFRFSTDFFFFFFSVVDFPSQLKGNVQIYKLCIFIHINK